MEMSPHAKKEFEAVKLTAKPNTVKSINNDLQKLGLTKGDTVIVHSAMSKIGWIAGGPETVIDALMEVLTPQGNLIMPTMTTGNTNPENWQNPPVPQDWWPIIRAEMSPYRPKITPTRGMGKIPETFRNYPGVYRSLHPTCSFAAWGKNAKEIVKQHPIDETFGEKSPLGKIRKLNAKILLLGVTHENNTSLHFAEWLAKLPNHPIETQGSALLVNGKREWITWNEIMYDSDDFAICGDAYEQSINYKRGKIGVAESRLINMSNIIDFAIEWLRKNRRYEKS